MSRAEVRTAVVDWFSGNAATPPGNTPVTLLNTVYHAQPYVVDGAAFFPPLDPDSTDPGGIL